MTATVTATPARIAMSRSTLLEVPQRSGARVASGAGTLWLTLDDDLRDIVLAAGESFEVPPGRRALVYALDDAVLELATDVAEVARPSPPRRRGWLAGFTPRPA